MIWILACKTQGIFSKEKQESEKVKILQYKKYNYNANVILMCSVHAADDLLGDVGQILLVAALGYP